MLLHKDAANRRVDGDTDEAKLPEENSNCIFENQKSCT